MEHTDYGRINACRLCGYFAGFVHGMDLGILASPGVFPLPGEKIPSHLIRLVECPSCGLTQLLDNQDIGSLYGLTYGYRSSLNPSMVHHLKQQAARIHLSYLAEGDTVIDIGSNDGTFLAELNRINSSYELVGVDPLAKHLFHHQACKYPGKTKLYNEFFPTDELEPYNGKVRVVTSFAMLYDTVDPIGFGYAVKRLLKPNGVWMFEVADWPTLANLGAYDTVCPEHILYFSVRSIKHLAESIGMKLHSINLTTTNGGSLLVILTKDERLIDPRDQEVIDSRLELEKNGIDWNTLNNLRDETRKSVHAFFEQHQGKKIYGLGASTKGNVLLQTTGITKEMLPFICDVNQDKWGRVTPGTQIPIVDAAKEKEADFLFVLPWHFRENILANGNPNVRYVFPLPKFNVA